jgi:omega-amidase
MSSSTLHIGIVQFDIAWERPEENMQRIEKLMGEKTGLDLVILPEMWSTGFTMRPENIAEPSPGPALRWMTDQARVRDTAIAGSISIREGSEFFNRFYCVFPDGHITHYDKKHLFSFGKEDLHYTSGNKRALFEIKGWRILPMICYDLRFPVWCRNTDDYDLLMFVANWPAPRIHHWDVLLNARAIENQSYVAGVNRIGKDDNGLMYNGHSGIYDMNGQDVLSLGEKEGLASLMLDKASLIAFREQFRFLQDRDHFTL